MMAREDFVTTSDEIETALPTRQVASRDRSTPGLNYMFVVSDSGSVRGQFGILAMPSGHDGQVMVFQGGQPLVSYPPGSSAANAELGLGFGSDRTHCAVCGHPSSPMKFTWFHEGRVVCTLCAPDELAEYLRLAYEYVDALERSPSGFGQAEWTLTLCEYAVGLKGSGAAVADAPSPLRSVPQEGESGTV